MKKHGRKQKMLPPPWEKRASEETEVPIRQGGDARR